MYIEKITLPPVPKVFLLEPAEIMKLECRTQEIFERFGYGSFVASQQLCSYYQSYIQKDFVLRYQLISCDLDYHVDLPPATHKLNYIYLPGGDKVMTSWKETSEGPVTFAECCKPFQWYRLSVKKPHSVTGVTSFRCSIVITEGE